MDWEESYFRMVPVPEDRDYTHVTGNGGRKGVCLDGCILFLCIFAQIRFPVVSSHYMPNQLHFTRVRLYRLVGYIHGCDMKGTFPRQGCRE